MPTFILYENAVGFSLFRIKQAEIIAGSTRNVQKTVVDRHQFQNMVELISHLKFSTSEQALNSLTCAASGKLSPLLLDFLKTHLPKGENITMGIIDKELARTVHKTLPHVRTNISEEKVLEVTRGLRLHFCHLVKPYKPADIEAAQLGLGHQYCRTKLHQGVCHEDTMIIQSSSVLEQLDKDINQCAMRIKEWYSWHFPELVKIIPDSRMYALLVGVIQDRRSLLEPEKVKQVEAALGGDAALSQQVVEAGLNSMGMDLRPQDLQQIMRFGSKITRMTDYRENLSLYVGDKMKQVAPNLTALIGDNIGSKLISKAGSLLKLAKCPSSTVQILGAEKALFRALKTRGKTPKYGILYNSSYLGKAQGRDKGRMARFVANKASLASRMDAFGVEGSSEGVYGEMMKVQLEQRLEKMLGNQSGEGTEGGPMKNVEVMARARAKLGDKRKREGEDVQPGKDNLKKRKLDHVSAKEKMTDEEPQQQHEEERDEDEDDDEEGKSTVEQWILDESANPNITVSRKKRKRKSKKKSVIIPVAEGVVLETAAPTTENEKKKKKRKKKKEKKSKDMSEDEKKKRKEERRRKRKERKEKKEKKKKKKKKKKKNE